MRPLAGSAAVLMLLTACDRGLAGEAPPPAVRFELRGLRNVGETSTYGASSSTTYRHVATIVAHAEDSASLRRTYTVCYRVRRLSGGDPTSPREPNALACAIVMNGVGDLDLYAGLRSSADSWEPEKIELTPHAFDFWYPISGSPVSEQ